MDIHDYLENLRDSESQEETIEMNIEKSHDINTKEIETDNESDGIHELKYDDKKSFKNMAPKKNILNYRNSIMKSVMTHSGDTKNFNVKSYIKAARTSKITSPNIFSSNVDQKDRLNKLRSSSQPSKSNQEHLWKNDVLIKSLDPNNKHDADTYIWWPDKPPRNIKTDFSEDINDELKIDSNKTLKIKKLNEIVEEVASEVISGKITTIENAICKLRTIFEENNTFTNVNKKNVILLNFEDDTCIPVLEIERSLMEIINKWYTDCDLILDIEETNISIPESISVQDLSGVLFNEISYKYKDEYLNNYLPLVINNTITNETIKSYERKYFEKSNYYYKSVNKKIDYNDIYKNLNINIPTNISDEIKNNKDEHTSNNFSPWNFGTTTQANLQLRSEPQIINLSEIKNIGNKSINIEPFNLITKTSDEREDFYPYNIDYDILNPNFFDNSSQYFDFINPVKDNTNITVIFNSKFLQTLCLKNPNIDELFIINNHHEFGFIKLFSIKTSDDNVIEFINRELDKIQFDDIESLNKKLELTSKYIEFSSKNNINNSITEETQVKKYIEFSFTIDNDINNKMKASTLHDIIIKSNVITIEQSKINGFKTRLSKYLKDLGLEKKRYNDGYYYYGIRSKIAKNTSVVKQQEIDEYIKKRKELLQE